MRRPSGPGGGGACRAHSVPPLGRTARPAMDRADVFRCTARARRGDPVVCRERRRGLEPVAGPPPERLAQALLQPWYQVLANEENTPFIRAAMAAEATSLVTNLGTRGVGYINGDVTVGLSRLPLGEWIGVQADSHWASDGVAVGTATLFDESGAFGSGMTTAISNPAAQIDFTHDPFPLRSP